MPAQERIQSTAKNCSVRTAVSDLAPGVALVPYCQSARTLVYRGLCAGVVDRVDRGLVERIMYIQCTLLLCRSIMILLCGEGYYVQLYSDYLDFLFIIWIYKLESLEIYNSLLFLLQ